MKVSVCIAVFNGENFLKEQIKTIIPQLNLNDEIICVDDCSTDKSIEVLKSFRDKRIKIIFSEKNRGHVSAFSKAASIATGDIIMFSDQDDLWINGRVCLLKKLFVKSSKPMLVFGDFSEFGDADLILNKKHPVTNLPSSKKNFNFLIYLILGKSRLFGCCMAINRKLCNIALPFPKTVASHDLWCGYLASLTGEINFTNELVTKRRLHINNFSRPRRRFLILVLLSRLNFIILAFSRLLRTLWYKFQ